ncbi:DUF1273 domain-containing protein [Paenibacillus sp. M1]|uniref:DUF1273 domain-containing protein n=1 Tax=Paenibacillus haidiansis TaxID=1574488 RepID=A0ABU7VV89_9BACL
MKNILVTGYRAHELGIYNNKHQGIPYIRRAIASRLIPLVEEGLEWVITPGQYGVDLWACEAAIMLKDTYPHLKCSMITAFSHPEEQWNEDKQEYYRELARSIDFYASVSKEGYQGPWQFTARDELLLRKTDGILLVYDEEAGEASPKYFKQRALKKQAEEGYAYIQIGPEEIQAIADEERLGEDADIPLE